jgi:hypothetical protein
MRWKLYYHDGSTFSNEDGTWIDAPSLGALVLATEDPAVGRELDWGPRGEFFAWWPEATKPWGYDRVGVLDFLREVGRGTDVRLADLSIDDWIDAGVKLGRSVDNHVWQAVLDRAINDPYLPLKSAASSREQQ